MRIARFDWNDENEDHIARHGVDASEVEEVLRARPHLRRTRGGRFLAYGATFDGRHLLIVFALRPRGTACVITARDMTAKEKSAYRRTKR
jgi:uncharacterized DUF497 family protein